MIPLQLKEVGVFSPKFLMNAKVFTRGSTGEDRIFVREIKSEMSEELVNFLGRVHETCSDLNTAYVVDVHFSDNVRHYLSGVLDKMYAV